MKIPVTIVTGFLGSGKTTLISGLLKKNPSRRLAVLVNEFGEVSVDGALLRAAGEECGVEIHDLPNGCICCTIKDDFLPVMSQLQKRKQEIDHVLIETSGLALPTPVMRALAWPEIRNDFQLDAVLAIVDTPQLLAGNLEKGQPIPGAGSAEVPEHVNSVDLRSGSWSWPITRNWILGSVWGSACTRSRRRFNLAMNTIMTIIMGRCNRRRWTSTVPWLTKISSTAIRIRGWHRMITVNTLTSISTNMTLGGNPSSCIARRRKTQRN